MSKSDSSRWSHKPWVVSHGNCIKEGGYTFRHAILLVERMTRHVGLVKALLLTPGFIPGSHSNLTIVSPIIRQAMSLSSLEFLDNAFSRLDLNLSCQNTGSR
jgi:hypothetical protein